jgi:hypothetical protein
MTDMDYYIVYPAHLLLQLQSSAPMATSHQNMIPSRVPDLQQTALFKRQMGKLHKLDFDRCRSCHVIIYMYSTRLNTKKCTVQHTTNPIPRPLFHIRESIRSP